MFYGNQLPDVLTALSNPKTPSGYPQMSGHSLGAPPGTGAGPSMSNPPGAPPVGGAPGMPPPGMHPGMPPNMLQQGAHPGVPTGGAPPMGMGPSPAMMMNNGMGAMGARGIR